MTFPYFLFSVSAPLGRFFFVIIVVTFFSFVTFQPRTVVVVRSFVFPFGSIRRVYGPILHITHNSVRAGASCENERRSLRCDSPRPSVHEPDL